MFYTFNLKVLIGFRDLESFQALKLVAYRECSMNVSKMYNSMLHALLWIYIANYSKREIINVSYKVLGDF